MTFTQCFAHLIERPILTFGEQGMDKGLVFHTDASRFSTTMRGFKRLSSLISLNSVVDGRQPHTQQLGQLVH